MTTRRNPYRASLKDALEALPGFEPPEGGLTRMQQALETRRRGRRRRRTVLALAASVVVILGAALLPLRGPPPPGGAVAVDRDVALLMAQSRALEQTLSRLRAEAPVWDAASDARAEALRRDLSLVDLQLAYSEPAQARLLWRDRVALMSSLVRTHRDANLMDPDNGDDLI